MRNRCSKYAILIKQRVKLRDDCSAGIKLIRKSHHVNTTFRTSKLDQILNNLLNPSLFPYFKPKLTPQRKTVALILLARLQNTSWIGCNFTHGSRTKFKQFRLKSNLRLLEFASNSIIVNNEISKDLILYTKKNVSTNNNSINSHLGTMNKKSKQNLPFGWNEFALVSYLYVVPPLFRTAHSILLSVTPPTLPVLQALLAPHDPRSSWDLMFKCSKLHRIDPDVKILLMFFDNFFSSNELGLAMGVFIIIKRFFRHVELKQYLFCLSKYETLLQELRTVKRNAAVEKIIQTIERDREQQKKKLHERKVNHLNLPKDRIINDYRSPNVNLDIAQIVGIIKNLAYTPDELTARKMICDHAYKILKGIRNFFPKYRIYVQFPQDYEIR